MQKQRKFHYAWIIVAAGLLMNGAAGILCNCTSIFVKPVCESLAFSRGDFSIHSTLSSFISVPLLPLFGTLIGRYGARAVILVSGAGSCLASFGYALATELWHFNFLGALSGVFTNGIGTLALSTIVTRWFKGKSGTATGIVFSGSGIIGALFILIANAAMESYGWRAAYLLMGGCALLIYLPLLLFVVRTPEEKGLEPFGNDAPQLETTPLPDTPMTGLTRSEALRTPTLWLLVAAVFFCALSMGAPAVHTVPYLSDIGYSDTISSSIYSAGMIFMAAAKLVMGYVFDRLGTLKGSLIIAGGIVLFPVFALLAPHSIAFAWMYSAVQGLASSGCIFLGTTLTLGHFGRKDYARIFSIVSIPNTVGLAISVPMGGYIYDFFGSYNAAWYATIVLGLLTALCLVLTHLSAKRIKFS